MNSGSDRLLVRRLPFAATIAHNFDRAVVVVRTALSYNTRDVENAHVPERAHDVIGDGELVLAAVVGAVDAREAGVRVGVAAERVGSILAGELVR